MKVSVFRNIFLVSMGLLKIMLLSLNKNLLDYFYIEIPVMYTRYIMYKPLRIKLNVVIMQGLGQLFIKILQLPTYPEFILPLRICQKIISTIYTFNLIVQRETKDLLRNKMYNSLNKRTDVVYLSMDQKFIAIFIFSISMIIHMNIIVYYIFFTFISCILETVNLIYPISFELVMGKAKFATHLAKKKKSFSLKKFIRKLITGRFKNV